MPDSVLTDLDPHTVVLDADESYIETGGVAKKIAQSDLKDYYSAGLSSTAFEFPVDIETPANQDYVLWWDAPFDGEITLLRTKTQAGSCTVTGKIGVTALGGTANSATTSAEEQAHASANAFSKGDKVLITVSANAGSDTLAVTLYGTRT